MKTADKPECAKCPIRGDIDFVPDTLVPSAPVLVLHDRAGDDPVPPSLLAAAKLKAGVNVSFGAALRCRNGKKPPSGKKLDRAIASCRAHDDFAGVSIIIATGQIAFRATGHTDFSVNRGHLREAA